MSMKPKYRVVSREMIFEDAGPYIDSNTRIVNATVWSGLEHPDDSTIADIIQRQRAVNLASDLEPIEAGRKSPIPIGDELRLQKKRMVGWFTIQSLRS